MKVRVFAAVLLTGSLVGPTALGATPGGGPGSCPSDSKLLNGGPTLVFGDGPGTLWGIIKAGMIAAGLDEQGQIDYLNEMFGTSFNDLDVLKALNIQQIADAWDKNNNGYVCAFELRGQRAYITDPLFEFTYFGISDDRVAKK